MIDVITASVFGLFMLAALQDWKTGKVFVPLLVIPSAILGAYYPGPFSAIFVPLFMFLVVVFVGAELIKRRLKLPPNNVYFGLADVFSVPMTLTLVQALFPFWGVVLYAAISSAQLPVLLRQKFRRLLPWLVPPTTAALLLSFML